jgi:hypothetical protein
VLHLSSESPCILEAVTKVVDKYIAVPGGSEPLIPRCNHSVQHCSFYLLDRKANCSLSATAKGQCSVTRPVYVRSGTLTEGIINDECCALWRLLVLGRRLVSGMYDNYTDKYRFISHLMPSAITNEYFVDTFR